MNNRLIMHNIGKKRILLMAPNFYQYRSHIVTALENLGAIVTVIDNKMHPEDFRCSTNLVTTFFRYVSNPFYKVRYSRSVVASIENQQFDILFCINGFSVTKKLINRIKQLNPNIITYLFLWDSLCYWKYSHILPWFDVRFSFDHTDCGRYGLQYASDFIVSPEITSIADQNEYDLVYIGSCHLFASDRIEILTQIAREAQLVGLKCFIRLYDGLADIRKNHCKHLFWLCTSRKYRHYYKLYCKYKDEDIWMTDLMPLERVLSIEQKAKCIIDIPPSRQNGHSIRILEAVARGQKIITTDRWIAKDFPEYGANVKIIEDGVVDIDYSFFDNREVIHLDLSAIRIDNWLRNILYSQS